MTLETIADPCASRTPPPPVLAGGLAAEDAILLVLPQGLLGFPDMVACRLEAVPGTLGRFLRLCAEATPGLSFLLLPEPAAAPLLDHADRTGGCRAARIEPDDASVFFVVTLHRAEALEIYINRRAPLFIDTQHGLGAQVVLPRSDYAVRHPVARV